MGKKLDTIFLIDDREEDNFLHKRNIKKSGFSGKIHIIETPEDALRLLSPLNSASIIPDLIFLDLNMPRINGWELLEQYVSMASEMVESPVIYILSTNEAPGNFTPKDSYLAVSGVLAKPLTSEMFSNIVKTHFTN